MRTIITGCLVLLCISGIADIYSVKVTNLTASSTLPDLSNKEFPYNQRHIRYSADKIFDNNPETAWSENVEGPGIGETISLDLEKEIKVDSVSFMAGYFMDGFYKKNNRIRGITLEIPGVKTVHLDLKDIMEAQLCKLNQVVHFSKISIKVVAVYPGTKWDDTCLAEMSFSYKNKNIELEYPRIIFKDNRYFLPTQKPLPILLINNDYPIAYFTLGPNGNLTGDLGPGHQMGQALETGTWEFDNKKGILNLSYSYYNGIGKPMPMEEAPPPPQLAHGSAEFILLGINMKKNYFSDPWDLDCSAAGFEDILESWR